MTLANRWLMLLLLLITLSEAASSSQFPFNYGLTLKENKPALLKGDDNSVIFEVYQIDNLSTPDRSDLLITASLTSNGGDVADNRVRGTYTTSKSNRYSIEGLGKDT